jgi:hypothetical protein
MRGGWVRTYRTPVTLTVAFLALLAIFAVTPEPDTGETTAAEATAEPTPGPQECVVCPIDQRCDPGSGRCILVEHTPLPCVKTAKFDDEAGFCLPEGVPPPPAAPAASTDPNAGQPRVPRFPGGIGGRDDDVDPREPNLPGFGD